VTEKVFAFIDGQNLYKSINREKWDLRYDKLYRYLVNTFGVSCAILYLGDVRSMVYRVAHRAGFEVKIKRAIPIKEEGKTVRKTNIDADLIVGVLGEYIDQYDQAVIISGDSDFLPLYYYLIRQSRLKKVLVPSRGSGASLVYQDQTVKKYVSIMSDVDTKADILSA